MQSRPLERVQEGLALFNRGEYADSVALLSPAIEWDTTDAVPDGQLYRGREEVLAFWTGLGERWADFPQIAGDEVVRCENYSDRAKAWRASGLEPQGT